MAQPLTGKHILVVEDEAVFRSVLAGYLTSLGADVHEADNGKDALEKMAHQSPDLIICDLNMPLMGGFEFVERLRLHDITTPVLVVSATNHLADIARVLRLGVQDVLLKPIHDYTRLRESVMACLYPTMFTSQANEVEQLMHDLDTLNQSPGAASKLLEQLQPPVQQTLARCRVNYRQLMAVDRPGLVLDIAALSGDELAFYCLDVTQAANNHGVLAALLLRALFNSLLQEHLVHQQRRLPELPVLLNQVNQLLRRANLQGRFPLLVGYYHRELKRLILISAGLHATLSVEEQHIGLNNGVPLGTLEAAYLNQISYQCESWQCQMWGSGGRLRLMLSTD
ncbi:Regulator of RpoS [Dickeya dianthicola]|uniref:Regulator of RpoS n=1 Tax=Dickeya dianthicola TaxID=204039 RepID=A0AAP6VGL1_9GAMM|nr:two-component system response regulator RssB [Dickeya dianthicola]ATO33053.1 Hnr protein [Dickeya dianthicola RNS04.9]AYC18993.1 Regulator of RpoS [Dickeya dianthicola]MBI0440053.1 two-component system response regulator RssB [Dickeya dianthicola]MBI0450981.1 two-component system response regulator RssB [Dickeya dianthicola]MBI0455441.1 two-component system response regulator RssB [Dickeya dianthicola]